MCGDKELPGQGDSPTLAAEAHAGASGRCGAEGLRQARAVGSRASTGRPSGATGNRLEKLSGDREGQHSIRINRQYRVCFVWEGGDAYKVEVTDYN
jgi:hypothetical protein